MCCVTLGRWPTSLGPCSSGALLAKLPDTLVFTAHTPGPRLGFAHTRSRDGRGAELTLVVPVAQAATSPAALPAVSTSPSQGSGLQPPGGFGGCVNRGRQTHSRVRDSHPERGGAGRAEAQGPEGEPGKEVGSGHPHLWVWSIFPPNLPRCPHWP